MNEETQLSPALEVVPSVRTSSKIGQLVGALATAQLEYKPVLKDTKNPYYGSMYADLASVIAATQPALAKNGIAVIQFPEASLEEMTLTMISLMAHSSGEWIENRLTVPATMKGKDGTERFDPQSVGSATTYTRRYAYQALVGVSAEADDDGNAVSGGGPTQQFVKSPQRKSQPATAAAPTPDDLNAVFGNEEAPAAPQAQRTLPLVTIPQVNRMFAIAGARKVPKPDVERYISDNFGLTSTKDLNREQYDKTVAWIEEQ